MFPLQNTGRQRAVINVSEDVTSQLGSRSIVRPPVENKLISNQKL